MMMISIAVPKSVNKRFQRMLGVSSVDGTEPRSNP
jgi:hypothetical protein